eukprot:scaffold102662_cov21-Tisochrysis_lutea.AAC.1
MLVIEAGYLHPTVGVTGTADANPTNLLHLSTLIAGHRDWLPPPHPEPGQPGGRGFGHGHLRGRQGQA